MDSQKRKSISTISGLSKFNSPALNARLRVQSNQVPRFSAINLEQKLEAFRRHMYGQSAPDEQFDTIPVSINAPIKPIRYVRHFNVSVSLKKSRLLRRQNVNIEQLIVGKRQFNENPKEGVRWLIENKVIQNTPEDVANFLYNESGLSKRGIGEYLGEKDDFHIEVLKNFAHMYDFFSIDIVEALRRYLFTFVLPGEAQKIDRIIEAFSHRYYECNPDIYANTEICFILSFAIIILNTSLHNKNARSSGPFTSHEKFFNGLSEAIARQNLPDSNVIKNIYDSIKNNELKFPDDDIDLSHVSARIKDGDSTIIKEGWLWKQGGRVRQWKRRWFVITDGCLFYYESRTEVDNPRGIIPLIDVGVREIEDDRTRQFVFELFSLAGEKVKSTKPAPGETGKATEGHHTVYRMSASSEEDRRDWIRAIRIGSQNELPKQRSS